MSADTKILDPDAEGPQLSLIKIFQNLKTGFFLHWLQ